MVYAVLHGGAHSRDSDIGTDRDEFLGSLRKTILHLTASQNMAGRTKNE